MFLHQQALESRADLQLDMPEQASKVVGVETFMEISVHWLCKKCRLLRPPVDCSWTIGPKFRKAHAGAASVVIKRI